MCIKFFYQVDCIAFLQEIGFSFEDACHFTKEAMKRRLLSHTSLVTEFKKKCMENGLNYDDYLRAFMEIWKDTPFNELFNEFR